MTSTKNEKALDCIRNGLIMDGVGHRAVSFTYNKETTELAIRTMISQKTTEKFYGWNASVQSIKVGDYVVISSWCLKRSNIRLFRNTTRGLVPLRNWGGDFHDKLVSRLPENVAAFLKPRGGGPSYLPDGYWRSKYDMTEQVSESNIEVFLKRYLKGEWLDYVLQEAKLAPPQHLIMDWNGKYTKPLPSSLTNHCEYWSATGSDKEEPFVHHSSVWVLIHSGGRVEFIVPPATSGSMFTGKSRRVVETFHEIPMGIPNTVIRAVQFVLGAYEKDERSYGVRWFLYKK